MPIQLLAVLSSSLYGTSLHCRDVIEILLTYHKTQGHNAKILTMLMHKESVLLVSHVFYPKYSAYHTQSTLVISNSKGLT